MVIRVSNFVLSDDVIDGLSKTISVALQVSLMALIVTGLEKSTKENIPIRDSFEEIGYFRFLEMYHLPDICVDILY